MDDSLASMDELWRLNPNNAFWLGAAGWGMAFAGECDKGRVLFDKGAKLNPYHPRAVSLPLCRV
jgi:hypothetical protein